MLTTHSELRYSIIQPVHRGTGVAHATRESPVRHLYSCVHTKNNASNIEAVPLQTAVTFPGFSFLLLVHDRRRLRFWPVAIERESYCKPRFLPDSNCFCSLLRVLVACNHGLMLHAHIRARLGTPKMVTTTCQTAGPCASWQHLRQQLPRDYIWGVAWCWGCLLYTSDAADE